MKKLTLLSIISTLIVLVTVISCRKSQRDNDNETQSTADVALAEFIYNDVYKQVYLAYVHDTIIATPTCDTSYFNPAYPDTTFPKTLTIRFDSVSGCMGTDGITRKGTITAVFSGPMVDSLSYGTITFNKYYVNGNKVTGTKVLTYKGHNTSGHKYYSFSVSNASLTRPDGKTISWKSSGTREMLQGDTTSTPIDDVYSITETASGSGINGNTFTISTNSALIRALTCQYPLSGIITIQPSNLLPRKVDFGNGSCDQKAQVSIGGKTYDITLP